jgi:NitT/TauT family transport system substrate-binding protein
MIKPYDTPIGEPVRTMVMTEKFYRREAPAGREVHALLRAGHQDLHRQGHGREVCARGDVQGQITKDDFDDAIGNSPYSYDITPASRSPPT